MATIDRNGPDETRGIDEVAEIEPESKRGKGGQGSHGGDQAGPSSHQAGKPQAPQTGDPKADDRSQG